MSLTASLIDAGVNELVPRFSQVTRHNAFCFPIEVDELQLLLIVDFLFRVQHTCGASFVGASMINVNC